MTWLRDIYLYYYCLPIWQAVVWVLGATGGFWLLRRLLGKRNFWRPAMITAAGCCLAAIVFCTLIRKSGTGDGEASWRPFHSYAALIGGGNPELLRMNFMNTVLFYPLGLLGSQLLPEAWTPGKRLWIMAGIALALSAGIELIQFFARYGYAEADDILHNVLGMILGTAAAGWKWPDKK